MQVVYMFLMHKKHNQTSTEKVQSKCSIYTCNDQILPPSRPPPRLLSLEPSVLSVRPKQIDYESKSTRSSDLVRSSIPAIRCELRVLARETARRVITVGVHVAIIVVTLHSIDTNPYQYNATLSGMEQKGD